MTCWVYVLRDRTGRNCIGITNSLSRRIAEHNAGRTRGDRGRGPFALVFKENWADHKSARHREQYLKSGVGREWLKRHLQRRTLSSGSGHDRD